MPDVIKERIDAGTPKEIRELFLAPYKYFSYKLWNMGCKRTADIACGNAEGTDLMRLFFDSVIGVDQSPPLNKPGKINIFADVSKSLPFKDNEFDAVVSFETIEHLPQDKQAFFINELDRISKKAFILGSINKLGPNDIRGVEIYKGKKNPYHLHELDASDFRGMKAAFNGRGTLYEADVYGSFYVAYNDTIRIEYAEIDEQPICNYLEVIK